MGAVNVETIHEAKPSLLQIKLDKICFHLSTYRKTKVSLVGQNQGQFEGISYKTQSKREGRNTSCVRHTTAQVLRHAQHPEKTVLSPRDQRESISHRNTKRWIYLLLLVIEVTPRFSKHELMFIRILTQRQWKIIVK